MEGKIATYIKAVLCVFGYLRFSLNCWQNLDHDKQNQWDLLYVYTIVAESRARQSPEAATQDELSPSIESST